MIWKLPVDSASAWYEVDVTLDNTIYSLTFYWKDGAGAWFMDMATQTGVPVANMQGIKIVVDFPIGARRSIDPNAPPGVIIAEDTAGGHADPGRNDLGARVVLLYYEASELPVQASA